MFWRCARLRAHREKMIPLVVLRLSLRSPDNRQRLSCCWISSLFLYVFWSFLCVAPFLVFFVLHRILLLFLLFVLSPTCVPCLAPLCLLCIVLRRCALMFRVSFLRLVIMCVYIIILLLYSLLNLESWICFTGRYRVFFNWNLKLPLC